MGGSMYKVTDLVASISRQNIISYEEYAKTFPQIEIPVTHYIHGGMYGRQITIPKGTLLTGQLYKFNHFDVMISGDITVSTDTGERKRLKGFNVFKGMSGKKRAGYAHADTTWITFHVADGVDGEEIQRGLTAGSFTELEEFYLEQERADYRAVITKLGLTEAQVQEQVHSGVVTSLPEVFSYIKVDKSKLHGLGLFSTIGFMPGALICPARIDGARTVAGRYSNHASNPNAEMRFTDSGDILLVAKTCIAPGDEITTNYLDVMTIRTAKGDLCQE